MKIQKIIYTFLLLLTITPAMAQKKEISMARSWIKAGSR